MSVSIKTNLESFNKIYKVGDNIIGNVEILSKVDSEYDHITASLIGQYIIKNNKTNPPQQINSIFYNKKIRLSENNSFKANQTSNFPIKIPLTNYNENELIESYQGVLVTISYELHILISNVNMSDPIKIYIINPGQGINQNLKTKIVPYDFVLTERSIQKIKIENSKIPTFQLKGRVDNLNVDIGKEFNGWIKVMNCQIPIKSLEIQFVRNERVSLTNGEILNEISEIQNLQIGDGEILLDNEISLNMLFPRHFCCACIENKYVKLIFDVNIILVLENGYVITENIPLNCWRGKD